MTTSTGRPTMASNTPVTTTAVFTRNDANDLPARALYTAQLLIGAVRDQNVDAVADVLTGVDRQGLLDLAVTLAALVPHDASLRGLLQWNDEQWHARRRRARPLRPHGTHAAYVRHWKRREPPCADCVLGERTFQRARQRVRRSS